MTYNQVDYGISEDKVAPFLWRYTIFRKHFPGSLPKTVSSIGYRSYSDAEIACKQEIDRGLPGLSRN
jgi:hypothetical protein